MTLRKTKIVATLGPSSTSEEMLARMITAGVNVVRLNFSHGSADDHIKRAEIVRAIAAKLNRPIGVLCDFILLRELSHKQAAVQQQAGGQNCWKQNAE